MFARPDLLLPIAFSVSGLMIMAALVLMVVSARQTKQLQRRVPARRVAKTRVRAQTLVLQPSASFEDCSEVSRPHKRATTMHMFSGATAAALDEITRPNPARQRQVRMYG